MSKCLSCPQAGKHAFCSLSQESQSYLDANSITVEYPRGGALFHEGDTCSAVFVLCTGRIKLSATSREGRTLILRIAQPGDVLGLSAALSGKDYEVAAETLEPCRVRILHVKHLTHMLQQYADVNMAMAKALEKDYRAAFGEARLIALPSSPAGRLARLILDWAEDARQKSPTLPITVLLTHDELAAMTATTRETVTRTLGRFRKEKVIATHGVALRVLQPHELERLSAC
jgi:CRP/FNR family cyclic AMP-dependent transcriptional regulator